MTRILSRVELKDVEEKLRAPGNGLSLEVVTEAEVAQHLEERAVGDVADIVDVFGAETLLAGRHRAARGRGAILEVRLERHHSGDGEEQGRVFGDERVGRRDERAFALEKLEVRLA